MTISFGYKMNLKQKFYIFINCLKILKFYIINCLQIVIKIIFKKYNKTRVSQTTNELQINTNSVKINNYFNTNEENTGLTQIESFISNNFILISKSFDDYINGVKPMSRKIIISAINIVYLLMSVRFLIMALYNTNPYITLIFSNTFVNLGNSRMFCIGYSNGTFILFLMQLVFQYMEYKHRFHALRILNDIKHNTCVYPLNDQNIHKFHSKANFLAKYILKQSVYCLTLLVFPMIFVSTIISYLKNKNKYSLISITFWMFCTFLWNFFNSCLVITCFVIFFLTILYLRYQFMEINEQLNSKSNFKHIFDAIIRHNIITKYTEDVNDMFKYIIFIFYYMVSPYINIIAFTVINKNTNFYIRLLKALVLIALIFMLFMLNYICASVTKTAHNSRLRLYRILTYRKLSVIQKIKVQAFVEKLSGPDIGFYCYKLFAMNKLEFFKYLLTNLFCYLLILRLYKPFM